jgi:cytoskeletal protein RodZ
MVKFISPTKRVFSKEVLHKLMITLIIVGTFAVLCFYVTPGPHHLREGLNADGSDNGSMSDGSNPTTATSTSSSSTTASTSSGDPQPSDSSSTANCGSLMAIQQQLTDLSNNVSNLDSKIDGVAVQSANQTAGPIAAKQASLASSTSSSSS